MKIAQLLRMDASTLIILQFCWLLWLSRVCCQQTDSDWSNDKYKEEAAQTFNLVFHKYNHRVRPPFRYIEITMGIIMRHIKHLDLHRQELQTVLDIEMTWNDTRLQWYPQKVWHISANTSNVWTPDVVYLNSVAETKLLYPSSVRINHAGSVTWSKKEVVTTQCRTQPDTMTQNCIIAMGFMSNSGIAEVHMDRFFSNFSSFSVPDDFMNHEWNLVDTEMDLDINNTTNRSPTIEINLWLQRKSKATNGQSWSENAHESHHAHKETDDCTDMEDARNANGNAVISATGLCFATVGACVFAMLLQRMIR